MTTVYDVAQYILSKRGEMTAMKLQKLCYYSHAWHLVWEDEPLFDARIEAWPNGPVIKPLYDAHRREFRVAVMPEWTKADASSLSDDERSSIDAVLDFYGGKTAHELSQLTHSEDPWIRARNGLLDGVRSSEEIDDASIFEYYDGLTTV